MQNKKCQPNRLVISIIIALVCLISSYFFLFKGLQNSEASTTVQQVSVSERRMEIHEPSMPKNVIEITEIRNLQSSDFPSKFELDIKNVSDKPIFYVRFAAVLTNSRSYTPSGRPIGFDLFYGNRRLSSEREKAQKGDEPIPPGGTATLRTIESNSRAMVIKAQREPEFASKGRSQLLLVLQIINFGDGTSFLNDKPYKHQDVSLNHRLLMDSMQSASIHKFAFSHASVRKPDLNNDYSLGAVWFSNAKWDITQSNCEGSCFRFSTAQTQNGCSIPNCSTYYVEHGGFSLPCRCLQWVDWLCYYEGTPVNCPSAFNFACPPGGGCLEL